MLVVERQFVITEHITTKELFGGVSICERETTTISQDNVYFMGYLVAHSEAEVEREIDSYLMIEQ